MGLTEIRMEQQWTVLDGLQLVLARNIVIQVEPS